MCLGVPGQIVAVKNDKEAVADFWGVRKTIRLDNLTDMVVPGDYVIDHAGYAVRIIPPSDVADTLALYEVLLTEAGEDPVAGDIDRQLAELEVEVDIEEPVLV
jgi:hydrogenase expression/formation protein HypC